MMTLLTGCGSSYPVIIEYGNAQEGQTAEIQNNWVIHLAKLPEEFFISYEAETEPGVIETITVAKDTNSNIYYKKGSNECLFLYESGNYIAFEMEEGEFVQQSDNKYEPDYVEQRTDAIGEYIKKGEIMNINAATYLRTEEVLGRTCDIYAVEVKILQFTQDYTFAVDQETMVCLAWNSETKVAGFEMDSNGSFTCTRFDTERVLLPLPEGF